MRNVTMIFSILALTSISSFSQQKNQMTALTSKNSVEKSTTKITLMPPIEIQAVRASQTSPFTQSMVYKNTIAKNNIGQDIPFLLNQVPSVVVNSDAGNGIGYTGIRIRGTDASRINFTINGIAYNDPESQGVFLVNMPDLLSSTSSIQVQRGVGTSSNGAGAFGATVNILTNDTQEKAYGELNNSVGSFNTFKNTFKAGTGLINNQYSLDVRLSSITSDGYIDRASSNLKSFYISAASIKENSSLRFNIISGKEKTYQAWYGVTEEELKTNRKFNEAGQRSGQDPYENETDNYWQTHYQLFYNKKFNSKWNFNTSVFTTTGRGYYEQYKSEQSFKKYGIDPPTVNGRTINEIDLIRQLWLDNVYYGTNLSTQYKYNNREIILGGGLSNYDGNHFGKIIWSQLLIPKDYTWYDLTANKNEQNVFGKWSEKIGEFNLFGDLQLRNVHYYINGFRGNPSIQLNNQWTFLNPKAGVRYTKNTLTSYISYAKARKEPNRDDFEAGKQEVPRPETLDDFEAGIQNNTKKFRWAATLFYMHYKDQLVLTGKINDVGAYTRTNIPKSYRRGIELEGSYAIQPWLQISNNLAMSQNKIIQFVEYYDDYDNGGQKSNVYPTSDIVLSPSLIDNAVLTANVNKSTELKWISKYVSRQYLDNTSRKDRSLDPYWVNDFQVNKSFHPKNGSIFSVVFQVNNIFNKLYSANGYTYSYQYGGELIRNNYYYPMAGIHWMFALNIKL